MYWIRSPKIEDRHKSHLESTHTHVHVFVVDIRIKVTKYKLIIYDTL